MSVISIDFLEVLKGYPFEIKILNIVDPTSPTGAVYTDLSGRAITLWVLENPGDDTDDALATITEADDAMSITAGEIIVRLVDNDLSDLLTKGCHYTVRGQIDAEDGAIHPLNFGTDEEPAFTGFFNVI